MTLLNEMKKDSAAAGVIFGRYGCKVCAVYGGAGKWEMQKALKEGPEIVVGTPGRLIEMIKLKSTNMQRCTMMVREKWSPVAWVCQSTWRGLQGG